MKALEQSAKQQMEDKMRGEMRGNAQEYYNYNRYHPEKGVKP